MFKRSVLPLDDIVNQLLRQEGLETPLNERRLIDAWETVAGATIARYTTEKFIRNQVLFVNILNPALRSELSMMKTQLVDRLNAVIGARVITDIRIY
jgi:predicted nucleic acid-binding Zn ribbon protein